MHQFCLIASWHLEIFGTFVFVHLFLTVTRVIDHKGDTLLDYGHFNKKYDWKSGIERIDKLIAPESQTDANFMTVWKTVSQK